MIECNDAFHYFSHLKERRNDSGVENMLKEVSKYLYECDSTKVDTEHLNNFDSLRAHFEASVQ